MSQEFQWVHLLHPATLAMAIPILAVLLFGIRGILGAMRSNEPSDYIEWKREVADLRSRVEALERERAQRS